MRSLLAAADFNRRRRNRRVYLTIAAVLAAIAIGVGWANKTLDSEPAGWWEQDFRGRAGEQPDGDMVGANCDRALQLRGSRGAVAGSIEAHHRGASDVNIKAAAEGPTRADERLFALTPWGCRIAAIAGTPAAGFPSGAVLVFDGLALSSQRRSC